MIDTVEEQEQQASAAGETVGRAVAGRERCVSSPTLPPPHPHTRSFSPPQTNAFPLWDKCTLPPAIIRPVLTPPMARTTPGIGNGPLAMFFHSAARHPTAAATSVPHVHCPARCECLDYPAAIVHHSSADGCVLRCRCAAPPLAPCDSRLVTCPLANGHAALLIKLISSSRSPFTPGRKVAKLNWPPPSAPHLDWGAPLSPHAQL